MTQKEIESLAFEGAYRWMGSSPCEDCPFLKHGRHECEYEASGWVREDLMCSECWNYEQGYNKKYKELLEQYKSKCKNYEK